MGRSHLKIYRKGRDAKGAGTAFTGGGQGDPMAVGASPREE